MAVARLASNRCLSRPKSLLASAATVEAAGGSEHRRWTLKDEVTLRGRGKPERACRTLRRVVDP